jgi:acetyl-CoA carboxylase biotin carboxyl carrier protein
LDLKQIKQIIELMKRSELTEFAVEEEGFKLKIRRGTNGQPIVASSHGTNPPLLAGDASSLLSPAVLGGQELMVGPAGAKEEAGVTYIKSPMVGTFYRGGSPESKPFAEPGTKVVENTVVCIIEAMKIMNEIECEITGRVISVLVTNGQPVEYGQPLLVIEPL